MTQRLAEGTEVRYIYRCRRCEKAGRPGAVRAIDYVIGKFGTPWNPDRPMHHQEDDYVCPTCHRETRGAMVKAIYVADQKCGGKCVNAIGPACECSCGGKNHGKGYTFHVESVA